MNKRIIGSLAVAALAFVPQLASAEGATGMSGVVIDASTRAPIEGATVVVTRYDSALRESKEFTTDRRGFFADIALTPGAYLVTTSALGQLVTCIVNDVPYGVVRNVRIVLGTGLVPECKGTLVHFGVVDPDQLGSIYPV